MAKCPNCGRETARTEDWGCQWCGYPLLSGSYKKLDKTFRELREERLPRSVVEETTSEPEPAEEAEPELLVEEAKPEPEPEPPSALEAEPEAEPPAPEAVPVSEAIATPEPVSEPEPEVKPEPVTVAAEMTVEELLSAYLRDEAGANAKLGNQVLRVKGLVDRIEVKEALDIYYITLNSAEKNVLLQGIRCIFDQSHKDELARLTAGQAVTVQGKCGGSIIDLRLRDCVLV
ncbi:MAG: hypothetical protein Q8O55_12450 [Dehalococcoidales bacterium]|nr:hypothetical protein [Dehalococcoidales bacterium]